VAPAAATVGAWTAAVWTPPVAATLVEPRVAVETATIGTPIVAAPASDGSYAPLLLDPAVVTTPDDADAWHARLRAIVRDEWERATRSEETVRRADALFGPATSAAVLNRFVGWATAAETT
jgi:hypothetical protein